MALTSPTAIADDVAADAAGDQFGSGSGPSAQADFLPASGKESGHPYAEFDCTKGSQTAVLWYDEIGGVWVSMNSGFRASGSLAETQTGISIPASGRSSPKVIDVALQENASDAFAYAGASVRGACSATEGGQRDYYCSVNNSLSHVSALVLYHVDAKSGAVFSLKEAGRSSSERSAAVEPGGETEAAPQPTSTQPDLYASCSYTVTSYKAIATDLRTYLATHSIPASLHDDFTAMGDDLDLMGEQAESSGRGRAGVTLQDAGAVYAADAVEVETAGQLQSPPDSFAATLRQACSSSFVAAGLTAGGSSSGGNTGSSTVTTDSMVCEDRNAPNIRVTADGTTCTKADALLVALPDEPLGRQSIQGWICDTPDRGGLTTCTLSTASVTFSVDAAGGATIGQTGSAPLVHCSVPTYNQDLQVSGASCSVAASVVRDASKSPGCAVGDSDGNATAGTCEVDGFDCQATLGYPPGQSEGEASPSYDCTEPSGAKVSWFSPV